MSKFYDSFTTADARTANGALTNSTTGNKVLDLFSTVGSLRGKPIVARELFTDALNDDRDLAVRCMLWARDARQGAGERATGRTLLQHLCYNEYPQNAQHVQQLLKKFVEVGRWDDLFTVFGTSWEKEATGLIWEGLAEGDALCAKWMPREGKPFAKELRKAFGLSPRQYRKIISSISETVEQGMCANEWEQIEYSHVPSQANLKYVKAFLRHDEDRYRAYLNRVTKGEVKMNASVAYPYEIMRKISDGNADQMWKSLPNYMEGNKERILPLVDVSGSMTCGWQDPKPIDVAVGLGLYIAERNEGIFKDEVMTFSERPQMFHITGKNLLERVRSLRGMDWGMNTNLHRVFDTLLTRAVRCQVPQKEMPTMILIMSDMEFDSCTRPVTNYQYIAGAYRAAGYEVPKVVFWNLNARAGNNPVKAKDENTAVISGFSPAILKSVLSGKQFNPTSLMMDTLMKPRYNWK